jgi:hypothetical protein
MKASRINLCSTVRNSLTKAGYSTVAVCNAINAQFANLELSKTAMAETKGSSVNTKTGKFRVSVDLGTEQYSGKENIVLRFDAFNTNIEKAEKGLGSVDFDLSIPNQFVHWLDKLPKKQAGEVPTESAKAEVAA